MNWDRGLKRITLILSIIGAVIVGVLLYNDSARVLREDQERLEYWQQQKNEFSEDDQRDLIDKWNAPYLNLINVETGEEASLEQRQNLRWESMTGRDLDNEIWDKMNEPNLWGETEEEGKEKILSRNNELESLKEQGWQTFNGEALPLTPREVWNLNPDPDIQENIEYYKERISEDIFEMLKATEISALGFCAVWAIYWVLRFMIWPLYKWIYLGFLEEEKKK